MGKVSLRRMEAEQVKAGLHAFSAARQLNIEMTAGTRFLAGVVKGGRPVTAG